MRAGFLRVLRFSLPILILPAALYSSSLSSGAGTIGQLVANIPNRLSLTPQEEEEEEEEETASEHSYSC
jgi:hypothetical protein